VGESGCIPPAQSLISDYFDRAERPRAMAIYWMSGSLSFVISYLGGGWLIEQFGWRITFMVIGLPGIVLALLVKFTLREPRLEQKINTSTAINDKPKIKQHSLKQVLKTLWQKQAFRHLVMSFCIALFFGAGINIWIPTFFMRMHGMESGEIGTWLAFSWGVGGIFFTFLGGFLAAHYVPRKEGLQMKIIAVIVVLCTVFHILCYLSSNKYMALISVSIVVGGLIPITQAPVYASIQSLVEERMRSVALAFIFLLANLIGFGLGPLAIGIISDALAPSLGQESLRYALLLFSPGYLWCAFHTWKVANTIEEDIRSVESKAGLMETKVVALEADVPNNFSTAG